MGKGVFETLRSGWTVVLEVIVFGCVFGVVRAHTADRRI